MKALIAVLVFALAPAHVRFAGVSVPVAWLILAAEVLAAAVTIWLAVRVIRRFRSAPWPRPQLPQAARQCPYANCHHNHPEARRRP
jgi:hypothetical protein